MKKAYEVLSRINKSMVYSAKNNENSTNTINFKKASILETNNQISMKSSKNKEYPFLNKIKSIPRDPKSSPSNTKPSNIITERINCLNSPTDPNQLLNHRSKAKNLRYLHHLNREITQKNELKNINIIPSTMDLNKYISLNEIKDFKNSASKINNTNIKLNKKLKFLRFNEEDKPNIISILPQQKNFKLKENIKRPIPRRLLYEEITSPSNIQMDNNEMRHFDPSLLIRNHNNQNEFSFSNELSFGEINQFNYPNMSCQYNNDNINDQFYTISLNTIDSCIEPPDVPWNE